MHTDPVHSARVLVIVQGACACRVVPGACHKSCAEHLSCCAWCLSVPVIQTAVAAGHTWLTCTSTCQLAGRKSNWGDDHCVTLPANAIDQSSKMQNYDSIILILSVDWPEKHQFKTQNIRKRSCLLTSYIAQLLRYNIGIYLSVRAERGWLLEPQSSALWLKVTKDRSAYSFSSINRIVLISEGN